MLKVKKVKSKILSASLLLSIMLAGCSTEDLTSTPVSVSNNTVYERAYVDEETNEKLIDIYSLDDIEIYIAWSKIIDGTPLYNEEFLIHQEGEGYDAYISATSGNLYAIQFDNPTRMDSYKYSAQMKNYNQMEYVETLTNEILFGVHAPITDEGINYENGTITLPSLRLVLASYIPHNQEEIKRTLDKIH